MLVPLFAGPAVSLEPRDLPIAVAGPPAATAALKAELNAAHPGAFAILAVPDAASADAGIKDRSVYGAFVLSGPGVTVHVATAGSPAVAAPLTQAAARRRWWTSSRPIPATRAAPASVRLSCPWPSPRCSPGC